MIYFIADNDPQHPAIKIGVSQNVEKRLRTFQTAHKRPLTLLKTIDGSYKREASIHNRFSHLRIRGEWFKQTPELLLYIQNVPCEEGTVPMEIVRETYGIEEIIGLTLILAFIYIIIIMYLLG